MNSLQPHEKRVLVQKLQNTLVRKYDGHNFFCELTLRSTYGQPDMLVMKTLTTVGDKNPLPEHMSSVRDDISKYGHATPGGKNILKEDDNSVTILVDYSKIQ